LRLEANGLFTLRAKGRKGVRIAEPGLYRVVLWPRTDREGFVTQVVVAQAQLLSPAPVGTTPLKPLTFHLLGKWLGVWDGIGLVEVVPKDPLEVRPFAVRFLVKRPEEAPSPGGVVRVRGRVERGRLIGEVEAVSVSSLETEGERKMIPLKDPKEIPELKTEEEARAFWDTHEITEEFLAKAGPVPEEELPR
jgi:hypothetical protein